MNIEQMSYAWTVIAGVGGVTLLAVGWFIRLEAKVMYLEKDHSKLDTQMKELKADLQRISEALARIEGFLQRGSQTNETQPYR